MKSAAGKGNDPIKGYNSKNWYANYDRIFKKSNAWCAWCGLWTDHSSGSCGNLKYHIKNGKD